MRFDLPWQWLVSPHHYQQEVSQFLFVCNDMPCAMAAGYSGKKQIIKYGIKYKHTKGHFDEIGSHKVRIQIYKRGKK